LSESGFACLTMTTSDEQRLALLRANDEHRDWRSLDDRRFCVRCTRVFDGREVAIANQNGNDDHVLRCPTEDCDSTPLHWLSYGRENGGVPQVRRQQIPYLREF
jgi:hypothetical protein